MTPRLGALRRLLAVASALASLVLVLGACSSGTSSSVPAVVNSGANTGGLRGDALHPPVTLDAAARTDVFRASDGSSTTLGRLQNGHLMLVYFGYTHCPDVCPTTMADLGTALRGLPAQDQAHIQVVFVTSDPARDSPPVMKAWLSNFDQGLPLPFVGLTAKITEIDSVARSLGVPLSPPVKHDGTITVQHGAQTLAFVGGKAHVVWLAGTSPGDYEHDLSRLVVSVRPT